MSSLPRDVWLYIADFLPKGALWDMIAVNRMSFHIGMNARYREVHIPHLGEETVKLLVHLMDPGVAKRIRVFTINTRITRSLLHKFDNPNCNQEDIWNQGDVGTAHKYPSTLEGLVQALTDAVSRWTNVVEFAATWYGKRFSPRSFLPVAWSTFGPSLRKVSLVGCLAEIQALLSAAGPLPVLQELQLEFSNSVFYNNPADRAILVEVVAPFINRVNHTLEALSITSWMSVSLADFFLGIGFLPFLQQFSIYTHFNAAFPVNPDSFTCFLRHHSHNLKYVVLRFDSTGPLHFWRSFTDKSLGQWMTQTRSDPCILVNLQSLQIYPTLMDIGFDALLAYLGRSAETLTHLAVDRRYFNFHEVSSISRTLAPRPAISPLRTLRLNVRTLGLPFFDLFAETLPGLHTLSLYTGGDGLRIDQSSLDDVKNGLRERRYPNWKLYDIGIWHNGSKMDGELMKRLAGPIPSLRSFWGQGDMSPYIL